MKVLRPRHAAQLRWSLASLLALSFAAPALHAAPLYWDGTGTDWNAVGSWSTTQTGTTDPAAVPGNADVATFVSTAATTAQTVTLSGPQSALGLATNSSNLFQTTIQGSGDQTLSLGASGINHVGGGLTIGSATAGQKVNLSLTGSQTWTSSSSGTGFAPLVILNDVSLASAGAQTLTLAGVNTTTARVDGVLANGSGTLSLIKSGTGTWTLNGTNTYTGSTTISAGTLSMAGNKIATSSGISLGNGAILDVTGGAFNLASGQSITGTGATGSVNTTTSTGVVTAGNNVFSSSGTLTLTRLSVIGSGNQITGGDIRAGGGGGTQRGLLVGNGSNGTLTITGGSLTTLGGTNTDLLGNGSGTGTLIINGGSYINTVTSGSLNLGLNSGNGTLTLTAGTASIRTLVYNTGTGNGIVNLDGGTMTLSAITVTNGTVKQFNFNGGQFIAGAALPAFSGLTINVKDNGGAKIDTNGFSFAISDPLLNAGTGGLTKSGIGTLTLTGASTYVGGTTVNAGTLAVSNTTGSGTGTAAVLVNTTGTLAGTGTITGATNITGGTLAPGSGGVGTLATGALSFTAGTFAAELNTTTSTADLVNVTGNLNLSGSPALTLTDLGANVALSAGTVLTLIDYSGTWNNGTFAGYADDSVFALGVNSFKIDYNDPNFGGTALTLTVQAIPEPGTLALGGLALLGLAGLKLRRRRLAQ